MAAAVRLVLEERGFRAGRHTHRAAGLRRVLPTARATRTPSAAAPTPAPTPRNPSVIGIVGPYHSWCASIELPILNSAPGGPVPAVSPSNTYVGLTHSGPETTADEPDRYQPTGTSAYARIVAPDDAQGAALATLAHELGVRRLFLLHDETGYGYGLARYVGESARRLGVARVRHGRLGPRAHATTATSPRRCGAPAPTACSWPAAPARTGPGWSPISARDSARARAFCSTTPGRTSNAGCAGSLTQHRAPT